MGNYFKFRDYERARPNVMREYVETMTAYLQRKYLHLDPKVIRERVDAYVRENIKRPTVTYIDHPTYGDAVLKKGDLFAFTKKIGNRIITPSGSIYRLPTEKRSLIKSKIIDNLARRKVAKKIMLKAATDGDTVTEQKKNYEQSSIKIETNSVPGGMASPHNPLYDLAGFNSITSTSRHSIMCGYAHVEKLLEGNLYLPNLDAAINYCMRLALACPVEQTRATMVKFKLHIPSVEEVVQFLCDSLWFYTKVDPIRQPLTDFISSLSVEERTFVFYANNLKNLFRCNDQMMRQFLGVLFRTDVPVDMTVDPKEVFAVENDLRAMTTALNAELIERKELDKAITENPDGVRKLIAIAKHKEATLAKISDLIELFLRVQGDTPNAMGHPNIIRKSVIISDTDSVIFTTQSWVDWYVGGISFEKEAYQISTLMVYFISRTLEHVFARVSVGFGMIGEDVFKIAMKNEFLYPLMLRTPMAKHYGGFITIQEGKILPKPKNDIKGKNLRGSDLCRETNKAIEAFILWVLHTVHDHKSLSVAECTKKILDHEHTIYRSLMSGEKTYLPSAPIKHASDYAKVESSKYYYYELWQAVFAPTFGDFVIPSKGYDIGIIGDGKGLFEEQYLQFLEKTDKGIYKRLMAFREKNERKISRIIMPGTLKRIPEVIRPVIDTRKLIYTNTAPLYLLMRSLGVGISHPKKCTIASDLYGMPENATISL